MNTIDRINNDELNQAQEEANMAFCDAIDELARVYGVDAEGLRYAVCTACQDAILDLAQTTK